MNNRLSLAIMMATALALGGCAIPAGRQPRMPSVAPDTAAAKPTAADQILCGAFAHALQGDGRGGIAVMKPIDPAAMSEKYRDLRACMLERLDARRMPAVAPDDRFLADVLSTYREYWLRSLRAEHPAAQNEVDLLAALDKLAAANGDAPAATMDGLEPLLDARINARGWHALFGQTLPLREFMLWKTQTRRHYDVQLPQSVQAVTVVFMDDFASLGWAGFATCDRAHTGGWTKPDALYAVRSAYDLDSEDFRVGYLAHEAQHFRDHAHFPALEQPELEYRAKLVELASGRTTLYQTLDAFAGNVGTDRSVPHSFANGRVVHDLRAQLFAGNAASAWQQASVERINAMAKDLLRADTARLAAARPRPSKIRY